MERLAQIRAAALAVYGYHGARDRLLERLAQMGLRATDHAINRIDYAVDFLAPDFEPRADSSVALQRAKRKAHWND